MILTVDELIQELSVIPPDWEVYIELENRLAPAKGFATETENGISWVSSATSPINMRG